MKKLICFIVSVILGVFLISCSSDDSNDTPLHKEDYEVSNVTTEY